MAGDRLFPLLTNELIKGLEDFAKLLQDVMPLRPKHRGALPGQIRTLSGFLTVHRDRLPRDYMNQPPLLAAYMHYFLPWNLYRQSRLLAGLDLHMRPGTRVVDLGAGPLTFLLALWLARPAMRDRELRYLGLDRSEGVLKQGRQLFRALAGQSSWQVRTEKRIAGGARQPVADVLVMANFLNEIEWAGEGRARTRDDGEEQASSYELMIERWSQQVAPSGAILLIEPGMRGSGRHLVRLREAALANGWRVAAPCPHAETCPMPGLRNTAWCHFNFVPTGAPVWLEKLSRKAKLPKERASLSFLLLTRGDDPPLKVATREALPESRGWVRVVSEAFDLPEWQRGRYGCSSRGLVVLQDDKSGAGEGPRPGDLVKVTWPEAPRRDRKSGALVLPRTR